MRINNNIQALNAYRNLYQNQFQTSKNLEKLSSGLRINRAADDAAGLAISEKMRSQIRGLKMAERNALDGISLMQTAEGAVQEVHAMLQRMRELAVQAANDTNTTYDREQAQKEIEQLKLEIDSISEKTEFNTRNLLNGSSAVLTVLDKASNNTKLVGDPKVIDPRLKSGEYRIDVKFSGGFTYGNITQPAAGLGAEGDIRFADPSKAHALGEYTIDVREYQEHKPLSGGATTYSATIIVKGPNGLEIDRVAVQVGSGATTANIGGLTINTQDITSAGTIKVSLEARLEIDLQKLNASGGYDKIAFGRTYTTNNGKVVHGGIEFNFLSNLSGGLTGQTTSFSLTNNALAFQIGPNTNQNVMIDIPQMNVVRLGIEDISVLSHELANDALFRLDEAINFVSDARAKLGATQNRMEHTINNLQVTHENLTAAESRIRDADMALEMTEFTRNNILNQSATAMLAQANQLPQGVLQLLQ